MEQDIKRLMWEVFQENPAGQKVLEHLSAKFYDGAMYTKGDAYDSIFRLGRRDVVGYIINCCVYATKPENVNDE